MKFAIATLFALTLSVDAFACKATELATNLKATQLVAEYLKTRKGLDGHDLTALKYTSNSGNRGIEAIMFDSKANWPRTLYFAVERADDCTVSFREYEVKPGTHRAAAAAVFVKFDSNQDGIDEISAYVTGLAIGRAKQIGAIGTPVTVENGKLGEHTTCVPFHQAGPSRTFIGVIAPTILKDREHVKVIRTQVYLGASCEEGIESATLRDLNAYVK